MDVFVKDVRDKDNVLDEDLQAVFIGTPEETVAWLKENTWARQLVVCIGKTTEIILVPIYLERAGVVL
jgi:hypothetical protein